MIGALSCLFAFSLASDLHAQAGFADGRIVTVGGDTLTGEVEPPTSMITDAVVRFRSHPSAPVQRISVREVRAVFTGEGWYVRRAVSVDETPLDAKAAQRPTYPSSRQDTVFLSVLVDGPLSLYAFHDTRPHYYVEADGSIRELIAHEVVQKRPPQRSGGSPRYVIVRSDEYREQLRSLQRRCPGVELDVDGLDYRPGALTRAVAACSRASGSQQVRVWRGGKRMAVRHGLMIGGLRATMDIPVPPRYSSSSSSYRPSVGYFVELDERTWRTSLLVGLQLRQFQFGEDPDGEIDERKLESLYYSTGMSTSFIYVNAIEAGSFLLLRHHLSRTTLTPFVELGGQASIPISYTAERYRAQPDGRTSLITPYPSPQFFVGVIAGAGVRRDAFSLVLRIERSAGPGHGPGYGIYDAATLQAAHLVLEYVF